MTNLTADQHFRAGLALLRQNRAADAASSFALAVAGAPTQAPAHHMLGIALQQAGQIEAADLALSRAIEIDDRQADYFSNRSVVRCGLQQFDAAIADAQAALNLAPDHVGAWCNLGLAQLGAHRPAQAAHAFINAVKRSPGLVQVHRSLRLALEDIEDAVDRVAAAKAYVAATPGHPAAHSAAGSAYQAAGDPKLATKAYKRAAELDPDDIKAKAVLLFHLNYVDDATSEEHLAASADLMHALQKAVVPFIHRPRAIEANRPLRIGFVSGDLRQHSVSQFLLGLMPEFKAQGLWVAAYQTLAENDHVTARLKQEFQLWRDITDASDEDAFAQIQADRIDILFDLSGHTNGSRPRLFAMRPAPIAVTWLGYSATTANPGIDYILCNDRALPAEAEKYVTERPLRMPGPYLCFSSPADPPPEPAFGDTVTFGSFNKLNKLSDRTVAIWSRILSAAPTSNLLLKARAFDSAVVRDATAARFAGHGIDASRIRMLHRTATRQEHLQLYGQMAVALDTWPYSGTTTTMEALAMGVPVLTLDEGAMVSRVTASLLATAGLDEWIARDEDDYVEKAIAATSRPAALAADRARIRAQVVASPLCDPVAFTAQFDRLMRDIWQAWCLGPGDQGGRAAVATADRATHIR